MFWVQFPGQHWTKLGCLWGQFPQLGFQIMHSPPQHTYTPVCGSNLLVHNGTPDSFTTNSHFCTTAVVVSHHSTECESHLGRMNEIWSTARLGDAIACLHILRYERRKDKSNSLAGSSQTSRLIRMWEMKALEQSENGKNLGTRLAAFWIDLRYTYASVSLVDFGQIPEGAKMYTDNYHESHLYLLKCSPNLGMRRQASWPCILPRVGGNIGVSPR